jgi:hypothetical protein
MTRAEGHAATGTSWTSQCAGPALIICLVVLASLPSLIGLVHPDPLGATALASSHTTPGYLPGTFFTDADVGWTAQALGHRAALDWLHGTVPWWNPFEGLGSPLAAEMESAAFFPPVLLMALGDGPMWFRLLLEASAGLATYALVRELGCSRLTATVGGTLFALNGTFAWLPFAPMNPVPMLPLLLFGIERAARRPEENLGWVTIAAAIALAAVAGFPETAYLEGVMAGCWAVYRIVTADADRRRAVITVLLLGTAAGVLLSLPITVPFADYLRHGYVGRHSTGVGYAFLGSVAQPVIGFPELFGPLKAFHARGVQLGDNFFGPVGGYVTSSALVLAVAGALSRHRERSLPIFLACLTASFLAWSFGLPPWRYLTTALPFMREVIIARYASPDWELGLVLLACLGLEAMRKRAPAHRSERATATAATPGRLRPDWRLMVGCGVLAALGVAVVAGDAGRTASALAHADGSARPWEYGTLAGVAAIALLLVVLTLTSRRLATIGVAVVLVGEAMALGALPQFSAPRSVHVDPAPVAYLHRHLGEGRYFSFGLYHSNYGSYFGLAQLDDTDLPVPAPFATEIRRRLGPNSNPVHFDGLHVLRRGGPSPEAQALAHLASYEELDVRYFVAPARMRVRGLRRVFDDGFAAIYALPHPVPFWHIARGGPCLVTGGSRDSATVVCRRPATLVRGGLDLPGWTATVSGRASPVFARDGLLTAVRVGTGESRVRFTYAPPGIDFALAGFFAGALVILLAPWVRRRRRGSRTAIPTAVLAVDDEAASLGPKS